MKKKDSQSVVSSKQQTTKPSFSERISYHQSFSESLKSHLMAVRPPTGLSRQLSSRRQWSERLFRLLNGLSRKIKESFRPDVLFRHPLDMILLKPFTRSTKGLYGRVYLPVNSTVQDSSSTGHQAQEGQGYEAANINYSTVLPEAIQRNVIPDITDHMKYSHAAEEYMPAGETPGISGISHPISAHYDRLHQTLQQVTPARILQSKASVISHGNLAEVKKPGSPDPLSLDAESDGMTIAAQPPGLS
ncbi:MAG TPA: hypothetical protein G4O07_02150, partial [Dehalococcoidia bacterium]|nr:hypothetical protein [Dehalococcoidia bacterium]